MSRIKLLLDVVEDMRTLAESLQTLADAVASDKDTPAAGGSSGKGVPAAGDTGTAADQAAKADETEPAGAAQAENSSTVEQKSGQIVEAAAVSPEEPEEKTPTLEEVRRVLAQKSRSGYTAQVREMLIRHGADRLSAIDPKEYAAMLAEAEVLE